MEDYKEKQEKVEAEDLFQIRRLQASDRLKGFVDLLSQLSPCGPITDEEFLRRFEELAAHGDDHVIMVVEDMQAGKIVATGSIFVEKKFLRQCGKAGHIEDVVVDAGARGRHLGRRIIQHLVAHAKAAGCYKVILDCSSENRGFYEKCGFIEKSVQMAIYFNS
ncbi:glucose-6-phosphate acetyltransferase 1 [Wolffia australiana]